MPKLRQHLVLLIIYICCILSKTCHTLKPITFVRSDHTDNNNELTELRLPNDTKPINYNIRLTINNNNKYFIGLVNIEILIIETTNKIVLHSNQLKINKISVNSLYNNNEIILNNDITYELDANYDKTHLISIYSRNNEFQFEKNKNYVLSIKYEGIINKNETQGIYLSKTQNLDIITTQFEPTFARRAFPCYDEPHFKANFRLTLTHSSSYTALSNMPLDGSPITPSTTEVTIDQSLRNENTNKLGIKTISTSTMTITKFQETPLMSTYLVAFILHKYKKTSLTVNNVTHSVYYRSSLMKRNAEYTVKKSVALLTAMEDYFQVKYPLSKLDHIGVATTFGQAMENWGLIIYREDKYLLNAECTTKENLDKIVAITHEMVHQWFGNLVSPKWWSYIWLNEGFATYFSYVIMSKVFPDCVDDNLYHIDSLTNAFVSINKRPLTTYLLEENDIISAFDRVSYHRGAAIIRMLRDALTEETFRRGIFNYLNKFKYNSVTEDDLFDCLESAAIEDDRKYFNKNGFLSEYIKTWTQNRGYPEITVHRNYTTNQISITQNPIALNFDKNWYIPISITTSRQSVSSISNAINYIYQIDFIMPPITNYTYDLNQLIVSENLTENDWILVNNKVSGLFNVYYDTNNLKLITKTLKTNPTHIDINNRIQILRDVYINFMKNKKNINILLDILSYLQYETDLLPWIEIIERLDRLDENFSWCTIYPQFKMFLKDLLKPITNIILQEYYDDVPMNKNVHQRKLFGLNHHILKLSCRLGIEECLQVSYKILIMCLKNPNENFLECVDESEHYFCGGMRIVTTEEFQKILEQSIIHSELSSILETLDIFKCIENEEHLQLLLNKILILINDPDIEEKRKLYQSLNEIAKSSKNNMKLTFEFMLEHFDDLQKNQNNFMKLLSKLYLDDITYEHKYLYEQIMSKLNDQNETHIHVQSSREKDESDLKEFLNQLHLENCDRATPWLINYKIYTSNNNAEMNN